MKSIKYNNKDIQLEVMEELYKIYEQNMKKIAKTIVKFDDDHKKKWIEVNLNTDNNNLIVYYDDDNTLLGYMFLIVSNEMNYISELQLIENKQEDGESFKTVAKETFKYLTPGKPIKYRTWPTNSKVGGISKKFNAIFDKEGRLTIEYETIKNYLDNDK